MDNATPPKPGWFERLGRHWGVTPGRAAFVLLTFACTGFTLMFLKRPVVGLFTDQGEQPLLFTVLYYIFIFPVYNLLLLVYGAVFGQFKFFWNYEKRFFQRLFQRFRRKAKA